jgi:HEAT repeat protein
MTGLLTAVVAALAAAVLLMLQLIVVIRATALRRKRRELQLRPPAELALAAYLAGGETEPAPGDAAERAVLLAVAVDLLADLRGGERSRLTGLLERLGYVAEAQARLTGRSRVARQRAAETLAVLATPSVVPALAAGLSDRDVVVRTTCARTLAEIGGQEFTGAVMGIAANDMAAAPGSAAAVILALGASQPAALGPLLGRGAPPQARAVAIRVAGELRLSEHAPLLRECLHDRDELAAHAARGLGRIGDIDAAGELTRIVLGTGRTVPARVAAIAALGAIGDPGSLGVLEGQLHAPCWPVAEAAARALAQLGPPGEAALERAAGSGSREVCELAEAARQQ